MRDFLNRKTRRPDRFEQLAMNYAESYLGKGELERILQRDDTPEESTWLDRWLQWLRA